MYCKINQTELHRKREDQGGISVSRSIRESLRVNFSITDLIVTYGQAFIDKIMDSLPDQDREVVKLSKEYWKWWNQQWYLCDIRLAGKPLDIKSWLTAHSEINDTHSVFCSFWDNVDLFIQDGTEFMLKGGEL